MEEKETLLNQILELLGEKYPIGLYEYLYKHREDLYIQLLELEDKIDKAFLSATLAELKSVLRDYWTFHIKSIKEFQQTDSPDLNITKAREEMSKERLST